jgi:ribosomal protein S18 acetylase RimI-like enzyme
MIVRPATPADAASIAAVNVASWRAAYRHLMPDHVLAALSVATATDGWRQALERGDQRVLVAEHRGATAGFLSFGASRDADAGPATREIMTFYVAPDCWSRGVGRALCQECCRIAQSDDTRALTLWTLTGNTAARRFYAAMGFQEDVGATRPYERHGLSLTQVRYRRGLDERGSSS